MLTLAFEGFLYWRRQTAGRLSWPLRASDRWALASRGVALVLLAWGLTQPQFTRWLDRQNVFFVLDMSDSVSLAARETAYRWATAALEGMKAGDRAGLITFGATRSWPKRSGRRRPSPARSRRPAGGPRTSRERSSSPRPRFRVARPTGSCSCRTVARTPGRPWWPPRRPRTPASRSTTRRSASRSPRRSSSSSCSCRTRSSSASRSTRRLSSPRSRKRAAGCHSTGTVSSSARRWCASTRGRTS